MTSRAHCMLVKLPGDSKTMAANEAFKDVHRSKNKTLSTILTEDDVPGAFLKGRKPEQLKNDGLKHWLRWHSGATA